MKVEMKKCDILFAGSIVLVTASDKTKTNVMTLASVGLLVPDPMIIGIGIKKSRLSHSIISESKELVLNYPTSSQMKLVDFCGMTSGISKDKIKSAGFTLKKTGVIRSELIQECPLNVECKVIQEIDKGDWTIFITEVVNINADESILGQNGKSIDMNKISSLLFNNSDGGYWTFGDRIGSAGSESKDLLL